MLAMGLLSLWLAIKARLTAKETKRDAQSLQEHLKRLEGTVKILGNRVNRLEEKMDNLVSSRNKEGN